MLLTEKSQFEKATYCVILTLWTAGKDQKKKKKLEIVKKKKFSGCSGEEGWIGRA